MEHLEDLQESVFKSGVEQPEAGATQPDVREGGIEPDSVRKPPVDEESGGDGGQAADAQGAVGGAGKLARQLRQRDGFVVSDEVPAADRPALREMNERARAVVHMNR